MSPKWYVIDSPDGCGKSTLIKNILDTWDDEKYGPVMSFYDPGIIEGHPMNKIRSLVKEYNMCPEAELLLFQACRLELVELINQRLSEGINVICDRYIPSTYVYQNKLKGQGDLFNILSDVFQMEVVPDHTIILTAPFDVISKRLYARFETDNPNKDKFKSDDGFRKKVWVEYMKYIKEFPEVDALDASGTPEETLEGFYDIINGNPKPKIHVLK